VTLDVNRLQQSLTRLFSSPDRVRSALDAEDLWAEAYHGYASSVEDVSGDIATNLDITKFRRELRFRDAGSVMTFAEQLDRAMVSYWTGVVFGIGSLPPGIPPCPNSGGSGVFGSETSSVVGSVESGKLLRDLLSVLAVRPGVAQVQAARFARALDRATKTSVRVTIDGLDTTPGPAGPLTIVNVCGVF
jgi:hypothetical protein